MLKAIRAGLMAGLRWRDPPQRSAQGPAVTRGGFFCCCKNVAISILPKFSLFEAQRPHSWLTGEEHPQLYPLLHQGAQQMGHLGYPRAGGWPGQFIVQRNYKGDTKSHTPHFVCASSPGPPRPFFCCVEGELSV